MPTPRMHEMEKSDGDVVAEKPANKEPSAELLERRSLPEGNLRDSTIHHAQKWGRVHQGIERVREFVKRFNKEVTVEMRRPYNREIKIFGEPTGIEIAFPDAGSPP